MEIVPLQPDGGINKVVAPAANARKEVSVHGVVYRVNPTGKAGAMAGVVNAAAAAALGGPVAGVPADAKNIRREVDGAGLNYRVNAAAAGIIKKKK